SVEVLQGNPFVNDIVVFDRKTMSGAGLIRLVRSKRYDLIIDLFGNPRTALVTRLSGARHRVGFDFRGRAYAYNVVVEPRGGVVHNTQFNLDALEAIGVAIQDSNIYFQFADDDAAYVDTFLRAANLENKFLVALNAGGGWYTKRWGLDRFAALGDRIVQTYKAAIVLTWGPGQLADVESIRSMMKEPAFIPPATTLKQLGALLKRSAFVVTNDSGPMHIAAALKVPVLGIYGPTNPTLQGPYGTQHVVVRNETLECLGCNFTECPIGHPCMLELSVDTVFHGVQQLLIKNKLAS
ncbi:MAG: glycosyltransferase family 9 protein, partial [bacterium]